MTPLQEAYLGKIRMTASANMEFFKKNLALLHRQLAESGPSATVDISDQGDITVRYADGRTLSVAEHFNQMENSLHQFSDINTRPQILGFQSLRAVQEGEPSLGPMQRYHYTNLDADFPNRVRQHFVEHYPTEEGLLQYPDFGTREIPILIVVGCGCGWHLSRLLMEYNIRHLIIVETDIDAFRLSTFFQDYVQLSRLAIEKQTSLSFVVEPDIEQVTRTIVNLVQVSLPPCFIHGAGVFYATSDIEAVEKLKQALPVTLWALFFGLGYFDDELISLRHSISNIRNRVPVYAKPGVVPEDAVAFIIGAGPSLDQLVPLLKKNQHRAVVFSCGTSLSAVAHAGITPDFHIEKERPFLVFETLSAAVDKSFLKGINFIGANVVYPPVYDLFKSAGMMLKSTDVFTDLLRQDGEEVVVDVQPTVTNTALNLAISLGFKKIYLLGVDMGYVDRGRHHSRHTLYHDKMPKEGPLQKIFSLNLRAGEILVEGNFGKPVYTNNILNNARIHIEASVQKNPDVEVFNLNDGAKITGAVSLHPEEFSCEVDPAVKAEAIEAILGAFSPRDLNVEILGGKLLSQVDEFIHEMTGLLGQPLSSKQEALQKMEDIYRFIFSVDLVGTPVNPLFRGSLLHLMSTSYQMLSIIADEGEAAAKVQTDFGTMLELLKKARMELECVLKNPHEVFGAIS